MAKMLVSAASVDAPADVVYRYVADMRDTSAFPASGVSDFRVDPVAWVLARHAIKMTAGGRTCEYRMKVAEPEPGRILTESDTDSSAVTAFTVSPQGGASIGIPLCGPTAAGPEACRTARVGGAALHLCGRT